MFPLLGIPSPRDLFTFKYYIDKLRIDKFWAKYYKQDEAYKLIRDFFLDNDYTHLIICPDDLIVKRTDLDQLLFTSTTYDLQVVSGTCTIDMYEWHSGILGITPSDQIPSMNTYERIYNWITDDSPLVKNGEPFEVGFNGLALCCIRRDVVEQIEFNNIDGCCNDVRFANDCHRLDIKLMADPKIKMLHLKKSDLDYNEFMVGKKTPYTYFEERNKIIP